MKNSRKAIVFPNNVKILSVLGENIKLAYKRRNLSQSVIAKTKLLKLSHPSTETFVGEVAKLGRNELCFCDSGKKFKKCCLH